MSGSPSTPQAGDRENGAAVTVTLLLKWKMLQAILFDRSLSPAAKVVAAGLLDRYNTQTGRCDPSYKTLADDISYDRRQVIRAVTELRRQGWVTTSRGSTKLPSNQFDFVWRKISAELSDDVQTRNIAVTSSEVSERAKGIKLVTPMSSPGDNPVTTTGDIFVPKVVTELSPKYGNLNREESGKEVILSAAYAAPTPAGVVFSECRKYLEDSTGMSANRARSILGGWRKNFTDGEIIDAVSRAQRHEAQDPVAFIAGCLRQRGSRAQIGAMSAIAAIEGVEL